MPRGKVAQRRPWLMLTTMTKYSQHPEVQVGEELRETVERVASGVERVIVFTDNGGQPLAALVSLVALRQLDALDALDNGTAAEENDRSGMRLR